MRVIVIGFFFQFSVRTNSSGQRTTTKLFSPPNAANRNVRKKSSGVGENRPFKGLQDFSTLKKHSFLTQQKHTKILEQLRRYLCFIKASVINDVNNIPTECLNYKSSFVYKNYSDRISCIGNWPGFLMTKMPYEEREFWPHLMISFQNPL